MIQLTFTFDSVESAAEFLASQGARAPQAEPKSTRDVLVEDLIATKKPRKPRADAGVPRGPYKTTGADAGATASSTPETTPQVGAAAGDPAPVESPPAQPTAAASAPTPAEPTLDDVKATMSVLSKKKNIDANIQLLAKFGVQKASALPTTKYAEFIAAAKKEAGVA